MSAAKDALAASLQRRSEHIDVISAQGSQPLKRYSVAGSVDVSYLNVTRSNVFEMKGSNARITMTGVKFPHPWLAMQLKLSPDQAWSAEISVIDTAGEQHKLHCSTSTRRVSVDALRARIALADVPRDEWCLVWINIGALVADCYKVTFDALDALSIRGVCQLKRVLSCRRGPDSEADDLGCLPAKLAFNSQTPFVTHVINPSCVSHRSASLDSDGSPGAQRYRPSPPRSSPRSARTAMLQAAGDVPHTARERYSRRQRSAPVGRSDTQNEVAARMAATVGHGGEGPGASSRIPRLAQRSPSAQPRLGGGGRAQQNSVQGLLATGHAYSNIASHLTDDGPIFTYSALPRTPPMRGDGASPLRHSRQQSETDGLHQVGDFATAAHAALFRAPAADAGSQGHGSDAAEAGPEVANSFDTRLKELRSQLGRRRRHTGHRHLGVVVDEAKDDVNGPGQQLPFAGGGPVPDKHNAAALTGAIDDDDDGDEDAGRWMVDLALGAVSPAEVKALAAAVAAAAGKHSAEPFALPTMPSRHGQQEQDTGLGHKAAASSGTASGGAAPQPPLQQSGRVDNFELPTMPAEEEEYDGPRPYDIGNFKVADAAFLESEAWRHISSSEASSVAGSPTTCARKDSAVHGVPVSILLQNEARAGGDGNFSEANGLQPQGAAAPLQARSPAITSVSSSSMGTSTLDRRALTGGTPLPGTLHGSTMDWAVRADPDRWSPEPPSLSRLDVMTEEREEGDEDAAGSEQGDMDATDQFFEDTFSDAEGDIAQRDAALDAEWNEPQPRPLADDQVELLYDPQLNCYFDPQSHRYYRLA